MVKATWRTSSNPRSVDGTDLLIRSLTTLLHLLPEPPVPNDPKSKQHKPQRKKRGRISYRGIVLDRAALLLVPGHEPGDVAAVSAIIHPYTGINVAIVNERPCGLDPIVVGEDERKTLPDPNFVKTPTSTDLAAELGNDNICLSFKTLALFLKSPSGQGVIPSDVHAEHLVEPIREGFYDESDSRENSHCRLKCYVLLYSFPKIEERFDARWTPGKNVKFRDCFIVSDIPHATFSWEEYRDVSPPESDEELPEFPRMPDDEGWLLRWLSSYGYTLDTDPNDPTKIRWTAGSGMYCLPLHLRQHQHCEALHLSIEKAFKCPQHPRQHEKKQCKQATGALDKLADAVDVIYLAVYQSPTFWKTMPTLPPLIQHHLVGYFKGYAHVSR